MGGKPELEFTVYLLLSCLNFLIFTMCKDSFKSNLKHVVFSSRQLRAATQGALALKVMGALCCPTLDAKWEFDLLRSQ